MKYDDNIAHLLNLYDDNSDITNITIDGMVKHITVEKRITTHFCPLCGSRMHSKGKFTRHPKHQILQDGYELALTLIGRTWVCSSNDCSHSFVDSFSFVESNKQITKLVQFQILETLKDINLSAVQVANQFHVSDTYVQQLFMQYVNPKRKTLTEYISIDEVYLNTAQERKYALVIMDFITGEILDILPSRRDEITKSYFNAIPEEERREVKYLICDMYKPYINYTTRFFHNSLPVTDSFHVIQWLNKYISSYIKQVQKRYENRDKEKLEKYNNTSNKNIKKRRDSDEVYILKKASWVLLRNQSNWNYIPRHYNRRLGRYMDTYDWEEAFLDLDSNFRTIRNLKDLYEEFNSNYMNDLEGARAALLKLIDTYEKSSIYFFRDFSATLKTFIDSIVNSFICIQDDSDSSKLRRLSNGPMESFNNIPSSYRSQSHGISNFEYARNRILWSQRENEPIRAVPLSKEEVKGNGKKRGTYNK